MTISIIIPVLNEALGIKEQLEKLRAIIPHGCEIIIVDGGSHDATLSIAQPLADKVVVAPERGRATQMNTGAALATGNTLLFLHSDTRLPDNFIDSIDPLHEQCWGFFRVKLNSRQWPFRIIEAMMNLRSQLTDVATGDQCLFVTRQFFTEMNGFDAIPIMEDVAFCKRVRQHCSPLIVDNYAITSARRWKKYGIFRTVLLMWQLRLEYFLGVSPERLVKRYES